MMKLDNYLLQSLVKSCKNLTFGSVFIRLCRKLLEYERIFCAAFSHSFISFLNVTLLLKTKSSNSFDLRCPFPSPIFKELKIRIRKNEKANHINKTKIIELILGLKNNVMNCFTVLYSHELVWISAI